MHALDAYYHASCLTALYNRARNIRSSQEEEVTDTSHVSLEAIALAELVMYIEEAPRPIVFQLSDLAKMYSSLLEQLGTLVPGRVNSTRLKDRLLAQIPELCAYTEGKEVKLVFSSDIGAALQFAQTHDYDTEAMHLAKAAILVRKELLAKKQCFNGTFDTDGQRSAVPDLLLALVNMILEGPIVKNKNEQDSTGMKAGEMISQLLIFNAVKRQRDPQSDATATRHDVNREPPLPVYLGLLVHAETRKKTLVDKLYRLGLSISYDRVMQISADLGNSVCAQFEEEGVVCPSKLKKSLFTTGSVDNIDHNPSSRTAKDSFHGTAISLTQHPTIDFAGIDRNRVLINADVPKRKTVSNLPDSYSGIQPYTEQESKKDYFVPGGCNANKPQSDLVTDNMKCEFQWLNKVEELLEKEKLEEREYLSWSAYFASLQTRALSPNAITSLLPLFEENAHSKAMIQHAMKLVKDATAYLNPGQTPVIGMDQPLYALAKQIQWERADTYGESSYVVMMGGLHIEMASLKMVGHWLKGSGWDSALVQADITTSGRADAILKASHITRSRYAHQVSACALHMLKQRAYKASIVDNSDPDDFTTWVQKQCEAHPQFLFWSTALELELLVLEFVRSTREGNFPLYIQIVGKLVPWMFALDLVNYSRWLPIHIRDLVNLKERHPSVYVEFEQGKFVVQKSQHLFSKISMDQNHEQENEMIKGDGGAVGLTESPAALRRWMISGPEIARGVKEFESTYDVRKPNNTRHLEQVPCIQNAFAKDVKSLTSVIEEMGNPFGEESTDLLVLDTKEIMPECVVEAVSSAKGKGQSEYDKYVEERLNKRSKAITDTIKQCNLPLFGTSEKTQSKKTINQVAYLKSDCRLFSRLYIACQAREGNLDEFFKHENSSSPPALSCNGKMRTGQKSELITCVEVETILERPSVDAIVIDAAAVVNMLPPGKCKTFKEYAASVFLPHIINYQTQNAKRIDLVWDRYLENSLKQGTREARGSGSRRRVCDNAAIPLNWKSFLRLDDNKTELFQYLAVNVASISLPDVDVISTTGVDVISSTAIDKEGLAPCNHEEADTRIFVHAKHASVSGMKKILIRTVDTDVVILAIAFVHKLEVEELWVAFGVGKHLRYLPIHKIASSLTTQQCEGLPFFHAVTGCDTVSYFAGRGKKTAFQAWKCYPEATAVFRSLSSPQTLVSEEQFRVLERFVVIMYSRTTPHQNVNMARQTIFSQGTRGIESIPPTQAALEQHVKRAAFQAGHVWGRTLDLIQDLPSAAEWGWSLSSDGWTPKWTTLPEASKACNELIRCGCKRACRGLCKCTKANLPCTALCACNGNCYQE